MTEQRITSRKNPLLQQVKKLLSSRKAREEAGLFAADGVKLLGEAVRWYPGLDTVILSEGVHADVPESVRLFRVPEDVMASISPMESPQGALFLCRLPEKKAYEPHPGCLLLDGIQDPGNLGTMIRTGEGAGITGVIMNNQTVDIFNPKTIRATMGSIFRVPFVYVPDLALVLEQMHAKGIYTYAAHLKGQEYYDSFSFREPTAFLIGNEGNGLSKEISDQAGQYLKIPMEGRVESLNASIAAALLMYEAHRQRSARL